jgi:hypothetical protein
MSRRQRFTFLAIAVAIAVVAVIVLADSSEDATEPSQTAATATPTPTSTATEPAEETPTPTPTPKPPPLLTAGKVSELKYTEGETIRFRVRSEAPEEIHVHCYDITRDVPAGRTITVSFKATITGICETEFHNSGEVIAELRVEPK